MLYMSSWDEKDVIWNEEQGVLAIKPKRTIYGDMTFLCYEQLPGGERRLLFRYWIAHGFSADVQRAVERTRSEYGMDDG